VGDKRRLRGTFIDLGPKTKRVGENIRNKFVGLPKGQTSSGGAMVMYLG